MGSSSTKKKGQKQSRGQRDGAAVHEDHGNHLQQQQQQQAFFNNDFYAEQTPLRRRENDSIFSAVDAPMYSDYPNSSNNSSNSNKDLLFMHSGRTRNSNNSSSNRPSSFHAQYSSHSSSTAVVDRWVKQAMRFILLSPVIVLVLWWSTAVLFVNHHQSQQHSHSQQHTAATRRGFSLPAALKPHRSAQVANINNNMNVNQPHANTRRFFPFGTATAGQPQIVMMPAAGVDASGVGGGAGYTLLDGEQQQQFISQNQQPMATLNEQQQPVFLPMVGNDPQQVLMVAPGNLLLTQQQQQQPMTGSESAAQRGMMMMVEQQQHPNLGEVSSLYNAAPLMDTSSTYNTPLLTASSSYNAPLMGASSSYNAPLMGATSNYNAPLMGNDAENTDSSNGILLFPPPALQLDPNNNSRVQARIRPHPRAETALADYIHQQNRDHHQGHGLLRGTGTASTTRYFYYDPTQVVLDEQSNNVRLPEVIYDQAGNTVSLDQLTQVAQAQRLPIYLQALEEQERHPFGVHHFNNGTVSNSTTTSTSTTTTNYTHAHPNTVETPAHRQLPYSPTMESPAMQKLYFNPPSSAYATWGENTAADNSIIVCTVAVMALLVGALSARRLRARSILSACIENESLTTRNQEAYDAAFTMNDEGGAYATFAAPAASHWKGDLEKFDV